MTRERLQSAPRSLQFFDNTMRQREREERCNTATALATVIGNEIRNESHCPQPDGKARKVGEHFGRESGDRPLNARLCHSSEGEEKETLES